MASNRGRFDPYKNFNFRVVIGAAVAAAAGFALVKRLLPRNVAAKRGASARPIETVGTSTPGFVGPRPKKKSSARGRGRA